MHAAPPRALGVWTALFLGVNAIVGSGIYLFPGTLATRLGPLSIVAFAATAIVCAPIALAYAELGRDHDRSGGTYRYVADAFGPLPGALLGWVSWVSAVVSWGAVANAVPSYLGEFIPALGPGLGGKAATGALIVLLGWVNWRGVRMGASVSNFFTIGKLVPLALLALAGVVGPLFRPQTLTPFAPHGAAPMGDAIFLVLFAYQGFEVVGIAAGEMKDARRSVPRGVLWSVGLSAILYCAVQVGYLAAGAPGGDAPLAGAARVFFGPIGATALGLGGLVSIIGFNAGTAMGSPRYLYALSEDGHLPRSLSALHPVHHTPAAAIAWTTGATFVCALFLNFEQLVALANVSVLAQYLGTSASLVVRRPQWKWRILGVVACGLCIAMLTRAKRVEFLGFGAALLVGLLVLPLLRRKS